MTQSKTSHCLLIAGQLFILLFLIIYCLSSNWQNQQLLNQKAQHATQLQSLTTLQAMQHTLKKQIKTLQNISTVWLINKPIAQNATSIQLINTVHMTGWQTISSQFKKHNRLTLNLQGKSNALLPLLNQLLATTPRVEITQFSITPIASHPHFLQLQLTLQWNTQ